MFSEIIKIDEVNRRFEAYTSVEIVDKQGQIVPIEKLSDAILDFLSVGGPLTLEHTHKIVGKAINAYEADFEGKRAIKIIGEIYKGKQIYDDVWSRILSGELKGLSIGGGGEFTLRPVEVEGRLAYEMSDVPLLSIGITRSPANYLSLITATSMAKSDSEETKKPSSDNDSTHITYDIKGVEDMDIKKEDISSQVDFSALATKLDVLVENQNKMLALLVDLTKPKEVPKEEAPAVVDTEKSEDTETKEEEMQKSMLKMKELVKSELLNEFKKSAVETPRVDAVEDQKSVPLVDVLMKKIKG